MYSVRIAGGPGAGVFPFWVGILVAICGLAHLREAWTTGPSGDTSRAVAPSRKPLAQSALSMVAYVMAMPFLGFPLATFLLMTFHLGVIGKYRLAFSSLFSLVATATLAYLFRAWFYVPLPRGLMGW